MTAVLTLLAFLGVLQGVTGAFAGHADGSGESCVGCPGCDSGQCGDGGADPLTSHHHCCTTSCLVHASVALAGAHSAPAPVAVGSMTASMAVAVAGRSPERPYRPPRV